MIFISNRAEEYLKRNGINVDKLKIDFKNIKSTSATDEDIKKEDIILTYPSSPIFTCEIDIQFYQYFPYSRKQPTDIFCFPDELSHTISKQR